MSNGDTPFAGLFCEQPFSRVYTHDSGNVSFCEAAWVKAFAGNLLQDSLDAIWNSYRAQSIRLSILDGTYAYCSKVNCPKLRHCGAGLVRNEDVTDVGHREAIDKRLTKLPHGPEQIFIGHDQTCGLACPACRAQRFNADAAWSLRVATIGWRVFGPALRDARTVTIGLNGEPLESPHYLSILCGFDWQSHVSLRIELITHGLCLTPDTWARIQNAHSAIATVNISVNAARAATYAAIQRGGDFELLLRNLEFAAALHRDGFIPVLALSFYITERNFREMKEFISLAERLGAARINFGVLAKTPAMSMDAFTDDAVHLVAHPAHAEFLALLKDPAFESGHINLAPEIQALRAGKSSAQQALPGILTWSEFCAQIYIDGQVEREIHALVDALKADIVESYQLPAASTGRSPMDVFVEQLNAGAGHAAAHQALLDYAAKQQINGRSCTYDEAALELEAACRAQVCARLSGRQRDAFESSNIAPLFYLDTGKHHLLLAARNRMPEGALSAPVSSDALTVEKLAEKLKMDNSAQEQLREVLLKLREEFTEIFSRPTARGGDSPARYLASLFAENAPDAQQRFIRYAQTEPEPSTGRSYLHVFIPKEVEARGKLARVAPGVLAAMEALAVESLLDISTGSDPFLSAVFRMMESA
jgi:hypothetical protein